MDDDARQDEIDQQDGQSLAVGAAQLARPYEGEAMSMMRNSFTVSFNNIRLISTELPSFSVDDGA